MKNQELKCRVLIYTRKPCQEYTDSLSNSIHFAYCEGNGGFEPLNRNYGILFAEAIINEHNVIQEKGLLNPCLFSLPNGSFGITAIRVAAKGAEDEASKGHILLWTSKDLITFGNTGLVKLKDDVFVKEQRCRYNPEEKTYEILWKGSDGICYRNILPDLSRTEAVSSPEIIESCPNESPEISLKNILPGNILTVEPSVGRTFSSHWTPNPAILQLRMLF